MSRKQHKNIVYYILLMDGVSLSFKFKMYSGSETYGFYNITSSN